MKYLGKCLEDFPYFLIHVTIMTSITPANITKL